MNSRPKSYAAKRVAQPSASAGVGTVIASVVPFLPPQYQVVAAGIGALFGLIATFKTSPADKQ